MKMKAFAIIIAFLAFVAFLYFTMGQPEPSVTKADLEKVEKEFKMQIDSVLRECDTLKSELRQVRANTDTLKAGQEVIYRTMQENKDKETSLWTIIGL